MRRLIPPNIRGLWSSRYLIVTIALSAVSISATHLAGFLEALPVQLWAIVGRSIALSLTSTFLFYCVVAAASARVISIVLSTYLTVLGSFVAWTLGSRRRSSLRRYLSYLKFDGANAFTIQLIVFFVVLSSAYARVRIADFTNTVGAVVLLVLLGYVLRIPALIASPKLLARRLRNPRRVRFASDVKLRLFALVVALLVLFAFALGTKRFEYLAMQPEVKIFDARYAAPVRVLATSGDDVLAFEMCAGARRYIFMTKERMFLSPVDCVSVPPTPMAK